MRFNTYPNNPFPPSTGQVEAGNGGSGSATLEVIAPEFNAEAQYSAGDLVFYDGDLYRFDEDHEPGAWDSTQVMGTNLSENMVMLPGDGLRRILHEFAVKLKTDGGLHFDENGAIYADHLPDYRVLENKTGQQWIDGRDVYMRVFQYENGLSLTGNTWVNSGTTADIDICISCFALSNDGTSVPVCAFYDSTVGLQFLNMRTQTVTLHSFILTYVKPAV